MTSEEWVQNRIHLGVDFNKLVLTVFNSYETQFGSAGERGEKGEQRSWE